VELTNLDRARELIARWVARYNGERLHAALHYLPPVEYYRGVPEARIAKRKDKLARARKRRERINRERLQTAALRGGTIAPADRDRSPVYDGGHLRSVRPTRWTAASFRLRHRLARSELRQRR